MEQWGPILVGLLAAASIVIGAHITLKPAKDTKQGVTLSRVFGFGTGAFFSAVCLDFLPDAWSGNGTKASLWIFIGALVMWVATHVSDGLFEREQHQAIAASTEADYLNSEGLRDSIPVPNMNLRFTRVSAIVLAAALSFHTFLEGAAVSLAFHHFGFATVGFSLAIILHKLPEGVLWGLALATVFPRDLSKIKQILLVPAICTIIGVLSGIFLANKASSGVINVATGFVAGAMLYIAFAELLPALRESTHPGLTRRWFLGGVIVMFILNSLANIFAG